MAATSRREEVENGMDTKEDRGRGGAGDVVTHTPHHDDDDDTTTEPQVAKPTPATSTSSAPSTTSTSSTTSAGDSASSESTSQTPSPYSVIMFDWDDTLLASSFLSSRGYRLDSDGGVSPEVDAQLRALEQCVCAVIQLALTFGHVNIVTNAETGWVQLSAQKFMPAVVPLLSKVSVISARSTFEAAHPDAPLKWKFYAFHERLSSVFGASSFLIDETTTGGSAGVHKNIISFGDSHVEREAIRAVTRGVSMCRTKSVKFAERPTPEQLRRQLELVTNCFQYIHNHPADLDLQLTVTLNAPSSPPSPPPQSHSSSVPSLATTEVI